MAPKLRIQTPPFHPSSLNKPSSRSRGPRPPPLTLTRQQHPDTTSELQRKLNAVVKRVIGDSASSSSSSSSSLQDSAANANDDDDISDYGDEEEEAEAARIPAHTKPLKSPSSISTPSSYTSLASLNPYSINTEDLGQHLSLFSPSSVGAEAEDRHSRDSARLARQLDRAHAAVVEEECAALRVLRRQARFSFAS
ncbi:hypothetical protein F5Y12DRAFT_195307 [Xylaria sp. FL1777]|nr:hypothetical protein F5Y12DRAFT_195307 [Xylaria sp. FL1777]